MALSRKFLSALGIDADNVDEIIEAHAETVSGLKDEIEKYKADAEKFTETNNLYQELKKKTDGKDYDALKKEFEDYKADIEKKEVQSRKEKAYREALKDANLNEKGIEKAVKYANWDSIEFDENGVLKDSKTLVKSAREEWAEYVTKSETKGANVAMPPSNTGGSKLSREEIYKKDDKGRYILSTAERQKALTEMMTEE